MHERKEDPSQSSQKRRRNHSFRVHYINEIIQVIGAIDIFVIAFVIDPLSNQKTNEI